MRPTIKELQATLATRDAVILHLTTHIKKLQQQGVKPTSTHKAPMIPLDQMRDHLINLTKASRDLNLSTNTEISLWYVIGVLDYIIERKEAKAK